MFHRVFNVLLSGLPLVFKQGFKYFEWKFEINFCITVQINNNNKSLQVYYQNIASLQQKNVGRVALYIGLEDTFPM